MNARHKNMLLLLILFIGINSTSYAQCSLITDNYSGQKPNNICAPIDLVMDVEYKFFLPVDPSLIEILYVWNDGTGDSTLIPAISQGDTIFTQSQAHTYPPSNQCSYTAEAYVVYNGEICVSSSRQEQTFSSWARDNENGAVIVTEPVVHEFCEGEAINAVSFEDNSTFNCNINIEPDKPNRLNRWVQFIYGTTTTGGNRIPNITIEDNLGNIYPMTDAAGNSLGEVAGPIIEIPIPADGPNQMSWEISAPAGGVTNDIFEVTLRNWNICNPYDKSPFDANPPADIIDGDNPPIETRAFIKIIESPAQITDPTPTYCTGDPVNLSVTNGGGIIRWYSDTTLSNLIYTGNNFDPTNSPYLLNNNIAQNDTFYVVEDNGSCLSPEGYVSLEIIDHPTEANAGNDTVVCSDTYRLNGNAPIIGTGSWSTTGGAIIANPSLPNSEVSQLDPGINVFTWTTTNGSCITSDIVQVTRDIQPTPADAGSDKTLCDINAVQLNAQAADFNGTGIWEFISGSGTIDNANNENATINNLAPGVNAITWTITSQYGACNTTVDTVSILYDRNAGLANAGINTSLCQTDTITLKANQAINNGSGSWSKFGTSAIILSYTNAITAVTGLNEGDNNFVWKLASEFDVCPVSVDTVNIQRFIMPNTANAGSDILLCDTNSTLLDANPANVGVGQWSIIQNPSGVSPLFTPNNNANDAEIKITSGNEGLYQLEWKIQNGTCITKDTVTIDFGVSPPQTLTSPDDSICGIQSNINANMPAIGVGSWFVHDSAGPVSFSKNNTISNNQISINKGNEGLYSLVWIITSGSCTPSSDTLELLFNSSPDNPIALNDSNCMPASLTLGASKPINANRVNWYDNALNFIGNFDSISLSMMYSDTVFYAAAYNDTTKCESALVPVTGNIFENPAKPLPQNIYRCGADSFNLTSSIGANQDVFKWFNPLFSDSIISVSDTLFFSASVSDSLKYSAYNSITGCESERSTISIEVNSVPNPPVVANNLRCSPGSFSLTASTDSITTLIKWFADSLENTLLDTGNLFITPILDTTIYYWVKSVNEITGCESELTKVSAIINAIPNLPLATDKSRCGDGSIQLQAIPGVNGDMCHWYSAISGGNLLASGSNVSFANLSLGNHTYWISSYNTITQCESDRTRMDVSVYPVPDSNIIIGNTDLPIGIQNVLYSATYIPGTTYNWTIPAGVDSALVNANYSILNFNQLGSFTLSMQETNSYGCKGPVNTKNINVLDTKLTANLSADDIDVCEGSTVSISSTPTGGTPGYLFNWSGDVAYLNNIAIGNPDFTSNTPGQYQLYVTVTDVNLNKAYDTVYIRVNENPEIEINIPDTIICAGSSETIPTLSSGGSGNYTNFEWTGDTEALNATNVASPIFESVVKGDYPLQVEVTDSEGCKGKTMVTINNEQPFAQFTVDNPDPCSPVEYNFTNKSVGASMYSWNLSGSYNFDDDASKTFYNTSNQIEYHTIILTAVSKNNCIHTTQQIVNVFPNPTNEINIDPPVACDPADVILHTTPGAVNYSWNFGDGTNQSGDYSVEHVFTNPIEADTSYNIQLVTTSFFGCYDTSTTSIKVHPSPFADFDLSTDVLFYPDSAVQITNNTIDKNWTYEWDFDNGRYSFKKDPEVHIYEAPGIFDIQLKVTGEFCTDSIRRRLTIHPAAPIAKFDPVEPGCMPLTVTFKNYSQYADSYHWDFGDGSSSNSPSPTYTYYQYGKYRIKLRVTGQGGTDTASHATEVYVLPNSYFDLAPRYVYVNDEPVHFFNLSDNADGYEWDFGDGNVSYEHSPMHLYKTEGTYNVTLKVWTENNCYDLYEIENAVFVEPSGVIIFPNAFRPDSPLEENRIFLPAVIDDIDQYHLMIFNRWGELIFESTDKDTGWDGNIENRIAKQDVYVWKVKGTYTNGEGFIKTGDVTLLR